MQQHANKQIDKFLLDAQRYAFRDYVKWAWFGYIMRAKIAEHSQDGVAKLAAQFIEEMGIGGYFTPKYLENVFIKLEQDFKILKKCN